MNRRRFARVRARIRFTFSWGAPAEAEAPWPTEGPRGHFELYATENLSANGASLIRHLAESPLPPAGAVGECAFNLDSAEIRCAATVQRVTRDGFAVRFSGLTRADEDRIAAWVFRCEARSLSRRLPV